jgi:TonB family protein
MSTAAYNQINPLAADPEQFSLRRFLIYSLILHGLLVLFIALSIYIKFNRDQWGGIGGEPGSVDVKLVGPPAGIPLLPKRSVPESVAADPAETLYKEEAPKPLPLPAAQPPKPVEKIAPFKKEKPLPETHKSKVDQPKNPPPDNAVPGKGAPPKIPSSFSSQPPGGGAGPVSMKGEGGGDFASKYGYYIEGVRRRISGNWDQKSIEPAVYAAHQAHTVVTFRIGRNGSISNIQILQTSGNLSMDNSARRALDGIQFAALPNDFAGSYVDVTFDFDLALTH